MFETILLFVKDQIAHNAFASGGLMIAIMGSIFAFARNIPSRLWFSLRGQFLVTLDLNSKDDLFDWVVIYFNTLNIGRRTRNITAMRYWDTQGKMRLSYSPAPGKHFFFHNGWPFWVERTREKVAGAGTTVGIYESLTIQTIGRKRERLISIIQEAVRLNNRDAIEDMTIIYDWERGWDKMAQKQPRLLDSVVTDKDAGREILEDIRQFVSSKDWYVANGIPYHRGYLFYGEPGTGKTSLAMALAGELGYDLCTINLSTSTLNDEGLMRAFSAVKPKSIVLMEDIDTAFKGRAMSNADTARVPLTFAGILNALDGVGSVEGTILIMTTNHVESLDPALIRPGRIDRKVYIGKATSDQAYSLFLKFFPDELDIAVAFTKNYASESKTPAELQSLFMEHRNDPVGLIGHHYAKTA
jgi:chaperone BCS1